MSRTPRPEPENPPGTPANTPALRLHRLGWNGGEASVEQDPHSPLEPTRDSHHHAGPTHLKPDDGHSDIEPPPVIAARLAGSRRGFLSCLADADLSTVTSGPDDLGVGRYRKDVMVHPCGRIIWTSTPLPGSVTAYTAAEGAVGGPMNVVTTPYDVETHIISLLGDLRNDYDVAGIVAAIRDTEWWPVPDRPVTILDELPDISAIVEQHDLRPSDGAS